MAPFGADWCTPRGKKSPRVVLLDPYRMWSLRLLAAAAIRDEIDEQTSEQL